MSTTGVCPYCGKTFKRLKSHLPHCKAKELSEPSQTQHDVTASKETLSTPPSSSRLTSSSSEKASKSKTPSKESLMKTLLPTESENVSLPPSTPLKSESDSFSSPSLMSSPSRLSPESMSRPTSSKKKTQRLADQVKMVTLTSSISLSAPVPSPSKPTKNTSSALKETARSKQVTTGPLKQAQPKPQPISSDQLPAAFCPAADPVTSATLSSTRRQEAGKKHPALLAPETKLESASKSKGVSNQLLLTTQISSLSGDRVPFGDVLGTGETPSMFLEDGGVQNVNEAHARATIQNVKDTLRRSKGIGQPGKLSLLDRIQTSAQTSARQPVQTEVGVPLGTSQDPTGIRAPLRNANCIEPLFTSTSPSHQLPDTSSQVRELSAVERVPTFHPEKEGFTQAGMIYSSPPPLTPQVTAPQPTSLTSAAAVLGSTGALIQRHRYEMAPLPASSPVTRPAEGTPARASCSSSSSLHCPHPSCPLNLSVDKTSGGVSDRIIMKDPEVNVMHLKLKNAIEGNLAGRRLGQVRLGELPVWLAIKTPSRPREAVDALQRGWLWYCRRYIDVRKGGLGGVSMLLAGYCVLGYVWNYPRIKCDRWRKYH